MKTRVFSIIMAIAIVVGAVPFTAITAQAIGEASREDAALLAADTATDAVESENGLTVTYKTAAQSVPTIRVNDRKTVSISKGGQYGQYSFTPTEDGYYAFYSISDSDTCGYILDSNMYELAFDDDSGAGSNFRVKYSMQAGKTYYLQACFYDNYQTGTFDVCVEKALYITKLEIESLPHRLDYVKGFVWNSLDFDGLVLKATWSDGTETIWRANIDNYYIGDEDIYIDDYSADEDGIVRIYCGGHEIQYQLNLIDNPVSSLEIVSGTSNTYVENCNGLFAEWYNEATGQMEEHFFYEPIYPYDVVIRINYKNGTSRTASIMEIVDGYSFSWDMNQQTPWRVGVNQTTISYLGACVNLPVTVIENPVDHIVINTAPTREYIYGDSEYGWLADEGYYFLPYDLTGLVFTVYYKNGSSKTYTSADIEDRYIDGQPYELVYDGFDPELGMFPVTFTYMGKSAEYTVLLKASPVASIAVTGQPAKTTYTDDYMPDFVGMEITVTYTDGSMKTVTLTDENLEYELSLYVGLIYRVDVDGYTLTIEPQYWDTTYYVASYLGSSCDIKGLTFTEGKEIASIELDNVSWDGDGMIVGITYADGTYETVTIKNVGISVYMDSMFLGVGKTENGFLPYFIDTYTDAEGNVVRYKVLIFDREITVEPGPVLMGDINGDGVVDTKDSSMLKRMLLGDLKATRAADLDGDGKVTSKDAFKMKKLLVQ